MPIEETRPELEVTFRHLNANEEVREYAKQKLDPLLGLLPHLRSALLEITFEHTRPAPQRYVAQVTLAADGTLLRVEERGPEPTAALNQVHDLLEQRIQDWKGRVYFERRHQVAAYKETADWERTRLLAEDQTGRIVRMKSHEIKPLLPEEAIEQMELLGHDFFFFRNADTDQYNVLYRRKAGGYGLIEPALAERPGQER